jgi:hypothetical protein
MKQRLGELAKATQQANVRDRRQTRAGNEPPAVCLARWLCHGRGGKLGKNKALGSQAGHGQPHMLLPSFQCLCPWVGPHAQVWPSWDYWQEEVVTVGGRWE